MGVSGFRLARRFALLLLLFLASVPCLALAYEVHDPHANFRLAVSAEPGQSLCVLYPETLGDPEQCSPAEREAFRPGLAFPNGRLVGVVMIRTPSGFAVVAVNWDSHSDEYRDLDSQDLRTVASGLVAEAGLVQPQIVLVPPVPDVASKSSFRFTDGSVLEWRLAKMQTLRDTAARAAAIGDIATLGQIDPLSEVRASGGWDRFRS